MIFRSVSLSDLASAIWSRRLQVGLIVVATVAIGVLYVYTIGARYRGEVFLRVAMIALPDFKRFSTSLGDSDRFVSWLGARGGLDEAQTEKIVARVRRGETPMSWVAPRFALTKSDVRDLTEVPKDITGAFLGVDITVDTPDPATSVKLAKALGGYVRDVLIEGRARDLTLVRLGELETQAGKLRSAIAWSNNELTVLERKRDDLAGLRARYPATARLDSRQVVSLENNGERFLPLDVQLLGVESDLVNTREQIARDGGQLQKLEFEIDYYTRARSKITPNRTAQELVADFTATRAAVLESRDARASPIAQGLADIDGDLRQVDLLLNQAVRLDAEPQRAVAWERFRRQIFLLGFLIVGLLLGVLYALMAEWRRADRGESGATPSR